MYQFTFALNDIPFCTYALKFDTIISIFNLLMQLAQIWFACVLLIIVNGTFRLGNKYQQGYFTGVFVERLIR